MENLYEIAEQTSRNKKIIEAMLPEEKESPLKKLYQIVYSHLRLNDNECMQKIYGKKNTAAFSRLKARLREIQYSSLVLQQNPLQNSESIPSIVINNTRNFIISRILFTRGSHIQSLNLLEKTIATAIKYHFTENIITQSRLLMVAYSSQISNKYKFDKYSQIQNKYLKIYEQELKSENYYLDLQKYNLQSLANPSEEILNKAKNYLIDLNTSGQINTPIFYYNFFRIKAFYYEHTKDYKSLLQISDEAIEYATSLSFNSPFHVPNLFLRKLWALIQSGQTNQATTFGNVALQNTPADTYSWFRIAHYSLKSLLYASKYQEAVELLVKIINSPKYSKLEPYYLELFNTAIGYVHLLVESGKLDPLTIDLTLLPDFKLGKYLNTTPIFSKDKRGINVSILLMHIAFLLQRKDYNAIIDRIDSVNQYAYRYLRRDDSFRSNCMIKMVIQMTKADFHPVRTERYTITLRKQLSSVNLAGSGENIEIEIIPFEVLWEIMIKAL